MKRSIAILAIILSPVLALCEPEKKPESLKTEEPAAAKGTQVLLKTSQGDITLELYDTKSPITVKNFLGYVNKKHYDGTVFHRVINGFMIQGGGFAAKDGKIVEKKAGKTIKNEAKNGLKNNRGTVAMARRGDPDSASSQFFINVSDNAALNYPKNGGGYAVFGKVIKGMDVVDKIKAVPTGPKSLTMIHPHTGDKIQNTAGDVPKENIVLLSATVVK